MDNSTVPTIEIKEKARNYVWSRILYHGTELEDAQKNLREAKKHGNLPVSADQLRICVEAEVRKIQMYNYLLKLIDND